MTRDKVFNTAEMKKLFHSINWDEVDKMSKRPRSTPKRGNQQEEWDRFSEHEEKTEEGEEIGDVQDSDWTQKQDPRWNDAVKISMLERAKLLRYKMMQANLLREGNEEGQLGLTAGDETTQLNTPEIHISKLNVSIGSGSHSPHGQGGTVEAAQRRQDKERQGEEKEDGQNKQKRIEEEPVGESARAEEEAWSDDSYAASNDTSDSEQELTQEDEEDDEGGDTERELEEGGRTAEKEIPSDEQRAAGQRPRRTCQTSLTLTGGDLRLQAAPVTSQRISKASAKKKCTAGKSTKNPN